MKELVKFFGLCVLIVALFIGVFVYLPCRIWGYTQLAPKIVKCTQKY